MPNLTMKNLLTRCNTLILFLLSFFAVDAQIITDNEATDIDTELNTPAVPNKLAGVLSQAMSRHAQSMIDMGYNVELMRDDQVVAVTIPTDKLFGPNDLSLLTTAEQLLDPFIEYTRTPGRFKLLIAVHTDDTGSESYRQWLCEQRIISLYDFFDAHGAISSIVYGFPMAHEQPVVADDTRNNRALNRRLELFIVPGPELISTLKSSKK